MAKTHGAKSGHVFGHGCWYDFVFFIWFLAAFLGGLTCFFWRVLDHFRRMPWSHAGYYGVVRMYMECDNSNSAIPRVVPSGTVSAVHKVLCPSGSSRLTVPSLRRKLRQCRCQSRRRTRRVERTASGRRRHCSRPPMPGPNLRSRTPPRGRGRCIRAS